MGDKVKTMHGVTSTGGGFVRLPGTYGSSFSGTPEDQELLAVAVWTGFNKMGRRARTSGFELLEMD